MLLGSAYSGYSISQYVSLFHRVCGHYGNSSLFLLQNEVPYVAVNLPVVGLYLTEGRENVGTMYTNVVLPRITIGG